MLLLLFQSVPRRLELSVDLFEEMATIARPPLAVPSSPGEGGGGGGSSSGSKRPLTDETGYIVCLYKVFRGDDGEKFERNWLFWTGELVRVTHLVGNNLPLTKSGQIRQLVG